MVARLHSRVSQVHKLTSTLARLGYTVVIAFLALYLIALSLSSFFLQLELSNAASCPMMKTPIVTIALFAFRACSQASIEPADFNIRQALLDHGVDVSSIPVLADLVERSSSGVCSIAVSNTTFLPCDPIR